MSSSGYATPEKPLYAGLSPSFKNSSYHCRKFLPLCRSLSPVSISQQIEFTRERAMVQNTSTAQVLERSKPIRGPATNLIQVREQRALNRTEFSKLIGISRAYVRLIEIGERTPSIDICQRWARALRLPARLVIQELGVEQNEQRHPMVP